MKLKRQKSSYYKILLSLLILGVLLVFSLSVIFTISSENRNVSIIAKSDRRALELIAYSNHYIDNSAKIFATTLISDNEIKKLLHIENIELWEAVNIINNLRLQVKGNSSIHSVYIYNKEKRKIYSTYRKLSQDIDEFFDRSMSEKILENRRPDKLSAIARKLPGSDGHGSNTFINVFTYIIPVYPFDSDSFPTAIIVNIDAGYLMTIINQQLSGDSGEIIVSNGMGEIIGHSDPSRFLTPLKEPYNERFNSEAEYIRYKENDKDQLITFFEVENSDWRYIKINDYKKIMNPAIRQRILLLAIGGLYLAVIWVLSVLFSKNLYKPIEKLVQQIERIGDLQSTRELDQGELDFVAQAFSDAVNKVSALSSFRKSNMKILKQQLLKDIAQGNIKDTGVILNKLESLDCNLIKASFFRMLLIRSDSKSKGWKAADIEMERLLNINTLSSNCEIVSLDKESTLIIFGSDKPISRKLISLAFKEIIDETKKQAVAICSGALSTGAGGIGSLRDQYREVTELVEYRIISGPESLISIDDIESRLDERTAFPLKEEKKLINALKKGDLEESRVQYKSFSEIVNKYSYENIRLSYTRLTASVFDYLNSLETNVADYISYRFTDFTREINDKPFISDIDELFKELFSSICSLLAESSTGKSKQNVEIAIEMISKDYSDPGLSLTMVAGRMNMSPVYLGRIFKQMTTSSFNSYLTSYRLEKSRELIVGTNNTIESVSKDVGITNTRFFFTKFKSEYGMTPSQFRKIKTLKRE